MDKKLSKSPQASELEVLKFYLGDYTSRLHVRKISRLAGANHRTVSLALQRLEKKGIMKHEAVGRSKQYFLNLDNFLSKEYIKNAESYLAIRLIERHFMIKKLLAELSPVLKNTPVILFGSYAKGKETKESDLDILVIKTGKEQTVIKKIEGFAELYNVQIQVQKSTQRNFELGVREKDNLAVEIMRNHVILNNSELFVDILWRYYGR